MRNEHGVCLFKSPEISTDNVSPSQDTYLTVSYPYLHRIQHNDIYLEIPSDKAILLRYVTYVYIRSRKYPMPQGAGN